MTELLIEPRMTFERPMCLVRQLGLCVIEARPIVLLIYTLRFIVGCVLVDPMQQPPQSWRPVVAVLSWLLAIGSVYLFDGVADVLEDRLNRSSRPIASGRPPRDFAL